jgi:hypothetical protein
MEDHKKRIQRLVTVHANENRHVNKVEVEKLERIDPQLAAQEIFANDADDPYDRFRNKVGQCRVTPSDPS